MSELDVSRSIRDSDIYLTVQIYIPRYNLAFEYQGEIHYKDISVYGSARKRQQSDKMKAEAAKNAGISLIAIPFWWDQELLSLISTIRLYRPGIFYYGSSIFSAFTGNLLA
jgi:hypothetical protein